MVVLDVELETVDVCGRLPGKSGTKTVTSDCSDSRLGRGVVVGGVVDDELVDGGVTGDVSIATSGVGVSCATVEFVDASVTTTVGGVVVDFVDVGAG